MPLIKVKPLKARYPEPSWLATTIPVAKKRHAQKAQKKASFHNSKRMPECIYVLVFKRSGYRNISGSGTFLSLLYVKGNFIAFIEAFKTT